jgi:hypothetical protein
MILIIGDSNYRNTLDIHGERLSAAIKEKIEFASYTSNESLRTLLTNLKSAPKVILVCAPLNEIVHRLKTAQKKGRDETIRVVCEEQNKILSESARKENRLGVIHLMEPAFLRMDPTWMEERYKLCIFYMREFVANKCPSNVGIGNAVAITAEDLREDKVHLNEAGMEKLYQVLEKDLKTCKENLGEGDGATLSQDWASQVAEELVNQIPTPKTQRKRGRTMDDDETDEEEDETLVKKSKKNKSEDKMDKIYNLVKEMKEETKLARNDIQGLKDKLTTNDKKVDDLRVEFTSFKEEVVRDTDLTAEMREDIDGLENENLRVTVVVRKLKAEKTVPKDNKSLRTYVQDLSRNLVRKVLGSQVAAQKVKYAAMLYSFVDPTKKDNKEGLVPPFKICFSCKNTAVDFREKAVKMAKVGVPRRTFGADQEPDQGAPAAMEQGDDWDEATQGTQGETNVCQGAYFTYFQTAATRFRVTLMWAVADAIKTKAKQVWVSQGNRPSMQIKEGGKVKSFNFVQTMLEYKEKIPQKILDDVKKAALKMFAGRLEKTFIVIKD